VIEVSLTTGTHCLGARLVETACLIRALAASGMLNGELVVIARGEVSGVEKQLQPQRHARSERVIGALKQAVAQQLSVASMTHHVSISSL